jgi:hypothetical protein
MKIDLKEYINGREDLFTATSVLEMEQSLTDFLKWHKEQLTLSGVVLQSEQLVCEKCDDVGWITEISEGVRTQSLCNCPKAN